MSNKEKLILDKQRVRRLEKRRKVLTAIFDHLMEKGIDWRIAKQKEVAKELQIGAPEVSKLSRGDLASFTMDKLLEIVEKNRIALDLQIRPNASFEIRRLDQSSEALTHLGQCGLDLQKINLFKRKTESLPWRFSSMIPMTHQNA